MNKYLRFSMIGLAVVSVLTVYPLYVLVGEIRKARDEDPLVWQADTIELIENTRGRGKLRDPVLFIGSSSIRFWTTLEQDMQPLVTIRHGFGGAKLHDIEHYAERLVVDFHPRAVVVYCGSNDIQPDATKSPETLLDTYRRFVERVHAGLPEVPIYYIAIKPTPMRWSMWETIQATNRQIRRFSETRPTLHYIETGPEFLGSEGKPNPDHFRIDRLHLNASGYQIWTRIIRARLLADLDGQPITATPGSNRRHQGRSITTRSQRPRRYESVSISSASPKQPWNFGRGMSQSLRTAPEAKACKGLLCSARSS